MRVLKRDNCIRLHRQWLWVIGSLALLMATVGVGVAAAQDGIAADAGGKGGGAGIAAAGAAAGLTTSGAAAGAAAGITANSPLGQAAAAQLGISADQVNQLKSDYANGKLGPDQINELCAKLKAKNVSPAEAESIAGSMGVTGPELAQIQQCLNGTGAQPANKDEKPQASAGNQATGNQAAVPAPEAGESPIEDNFRALSHPGAAPNQPTPERLSQFGYSVFSHSTSASGSGGNAPVGDDYQIGPGDTFNLFMWGRITQTLQLKVERDGRVMVPEIGPVQIAGLNFGQARQLLESETRQITGVKVAVTMGDLRTIQVSVIGEAKQPGIYTVGSLSHVSDALATAGGVSKVGSLRRVELRRGNKLVNVIDFYDLFLHGRASNDSMLQPQDVVFVPVIGKVAAVVGDVKRPAIYELSQNGDNLGELLRMAGGISAFGYTHRVQIESIQNHARRITLDVDAAAVRARRFEVRDGDLVKVYSVLSRQKNIVSLTGNVNRPGAYQWRPGLTVAELIRAGEGVDDHTFFKYALILRPQGATRAIHYIPIDLGAALSDHFESEDNVHLQPHDELRVFRQDEMGEQAQVRVSGQVRKPGDYTLSSGMRLSDLVYLAGGLSQMAYRKRAELDRVHILDGSNIRHGYIDVNLDEALAGSLSENRLLQRGDHLYIRGIIDKFPSAATVSAAGEVQQEGDYPWHSGMRVSDLVFEAKGLKGSAYLKKAELARVQVINGAKTQHVNLTIDLASALEGSDADQILQPDDRLLILQAPGWHLPWSVTVSGEVVKPGPYPLRHGERLSDLLMRSGGLRPEAYLRGAVFIRTSVQQLEQERLEESRRRLSQKVAELKLQAQSAASMSPQQAANPKAMGQTAMTLDYLQKVLDETAAQKATGRVVIHLVSLDQLVNSPDNMELENGDQLVIPRRPASVQVMGQVYNPTAATYQPGLTVSDYLWSAGGPTAEADHDNIYVIKADGAIISEEGIKNSPRAHAFPLMPVISGGLMKTRLEPGDTVYVPEMIQITDKLKTWTDVANIIGNSIRSIGMIGLLAIR